MHTCRFSIVWLKIHNYSQSFLFIRQYKHVSVLLIIGFGEDSSPSVTICVSGVEVVGSGHCPVDSIALMISIFLSDMISLLIINYIM